MQSSTFRSPNIALKLQETRRWLRRYVILQSLCAIVCWLLVVFWLGGLVDYLPVRAGSNETPRWARIGMLLCMAAGVLWVLLHWLVPRLFARIPDRSLALLIEREYPQLNNELVTAVECSQDADVSDVRAHQEMLSRVRAAADANVQQVSTFELFYWQPLWAVVAAAILGLLLTGLAGVGMNGWMRTWSSRLFALSDEAWPRRAELRADAIEVDVPPFTGQLAAQRVRLPFRDKQVQVPLGSAAVLQVSAKADGKQVPEVCTMFYQAASGSRGRANLRRVGAPRAGWQNFTLDGPPLDGLSETLTVDVVGLDSRLRDLQLAVVQPPSVASMHLQLEYPQYLVRESSSRAAIDRIEYRSGIVIPEGSIVELHGVANSQLSRAEYVVFSASASRAMGAEPSVHAAVVDGDAFSISVGRLSESMVVEIRLFDHYGLPADQVPRYVINMLEDTVPEVDSRLEGIGIAITPQAVLPIRGTVVDDHSLASVIAELALDDNARASVALETDKDGRLLSDVDLVQLREAGRLSPAPGMALGIFVAATDHYDLDDEPRVGRGQPQQLSVVTTDELLIILDRQELEQQQRLTLIISELEQMRELLQSVESDLLSLAAPAANNRGAHTRSGLVWLQQNGPDESAEIQRRSAVRAQQCMLQGDKSQQELSSLAARVDSLRLQLVNNRIDSPDRQARLQNQVWQPLQDLLSGPYRQLQTDLSQLMSATTSQGGLPEARAARASLDQVLLLLAEVKSNMQDMESFNELVDLVRGLLDDQDKLLEQTQEEQKQRILDFLK